MKILSPNTRYNGVSASVRFVNGVGHTDDKRLIQWFKSKGYKIEKPSANRTQKKPQTKSNKK